MQAGCLHKLVLGGDAGMERLRCVGFRGDRLLGSRLRFLLGLDARAQELRDLRFVPLALGVRAPRGIGLLGGRARGGERRGFQRGALLREGERARLGFGPLALRVLARLRLLECLGLRFHALAQGVFFLALRADALLGCFHRRLLRVGAALLRLGLACLRRGPFRGGIVQGALGFGARALLLGGGFGRGGALLRGGRLLDLLELERPGASDGALVVGRAGFRYRLCLAFLQRALLGLLRGDAIGFRGVACELRGARFHGGALGGLRGQHAFVFRAAARSFQRARLRPGALLCGEQVLVFRGLVAARFLRGLLFRLRKGLLRGFGAAFLFDARGEGVGGGGLGGGTLERHTGGALLRFGALGRGARGKSVRLEALARDNRGAGFGARALLGGPLELGFRLVPMLRGFERARFRADALDRRSFRGALVAHALLGLAGGGAFGLRAIPGELRRGVFGLGALFRLQAHRALGFVAAARLFACARLDGDALARGEQQFDLQRGLLLGALTRSRFGAGALGGGGFVVALRGDAGVECLRSAGFRGGFRLGELGQLAFGLGAFVRERPGFAFDLFALRMRPLRGGGLLGLGAQPREGGDLGGGLLARGVDRVRFGFDDLAHAALGRQLLFGRDARQLLRGELFFRLPAHLQRLDGGAFGLRRLQREPLCLLCRFDASAHERCGFLLGAHAFL